MKFAIKRCRPWPTNDPANKNRLGLNSSPIIGKDFFAELGGYPMVLA